MLMREMIALRNGPPFDESASGERSLDHSDHFSPLPYHLIP
jgi:hypothetical protein